MAKKEVKILVSDPVKTNLYIIDQKIKNLEKEKQLLLTGYLTALGKYHPDVIIDEDFNFLIFEEEEEEVEKENGKEGN